MGRLLLVRHGQASFGADDYDVLSETGWSQGRALGDHLRQLEVSPTRVIRGDMRRHRETAEATGFEAAEAPAGIDARWNEFDHLGVVALAPEAADVDISDRRAFQRVFELATARWIAGEVGGDEAGESFAGFVDRVRGGLAAAVEVAGSGETVLVVTSGGPIAVAASMLMAPDVADPTGIGALWSRFNTVIANSSVTQVICGRSGPRLLTFNEHTHLRDGLLTYR